ncbi:hypothetical protein RUM43_006204 [Polyplax serrata]|uniref:Uncharacterized protein n=1 Tax=Polyplax serrata TaxID=468196 RepID=A0AAN8PKU2_POLSC
MIPDREKNCNSIRRRKKLIGGSICEQVGVKNLNRRCHGERTIPERKKMADLEKDTEVQRRKNTEEETGRRNNSGRKELKKASTYKVPERDTNTELHVTEHHL